MMYSHLTLDELRDWSHAGDPEVLMELGRRIDGDYDSVISTMVDDAIEDYIADSYSHLDTDDGDSWL